MMLMGCFFTKCPGHVHGIHKILGHFKLNVQINTTMINWPQKLCSYLHKNNIQWMYSLLGLRSNFNTETVLVKILNELLLAYEQCCVVLLVLLVLSAAFEPIHYTILLYSWVRENVRVKGNGPLVTQILLSWSLSIYLYKLWCLENTLVFHKVVF